MEIEEVKKSQTEEILEIKNLGKCVETTEASITIRIQEAKEQLLDTGDMTQEIDTVVKENVKSKKFPKTKHS